MYIKLTCPQCTHKLGLMLPGSTCIFHCQKCKREWEVAIDTNGGIHALPFVKTMFQRK